MINWKEFESSVLTVTKSKVIKSEDAYAGILSTMYLTYIGAGINQYQQSIIFTS